LEELVVLFFGLASSTQGDTDIVNQIIPFDKQGSFCKHKANKKKGE
jgi:hypothetical protein